MWRVAWAGVVRRPLQSLLVAVTVALSVGVLGGSIVYADSARTAFYDDLARAAVGVDVIARSERAPVAVGPAELAAVAALPGVAHVDGRVVTRLGLLGRDGRVLTAEGETGWAVSVPSWPGFSAYTVLSGRNPTASGEAALDRPTAQRQGVGLGDPVTLLDDRGTPHEATVVGLVDFGVSFVFADRSVLVLPTVDLDAYAPRHGYHEIVVSGTVTPSRVADALGSRYTVDTGDAYRDEIARESAKYVGGFLRTLRAASLVALVVAILVAYNTFQILVTQRSREHALLRCVGAGRRQVVRLIVAESVLLGAAAAAGSVVVAAVGGYAFAVAQQYFGSAPPPGLVLTPAAVIVALVVAIGVTLASAILPALAAGRVSPLVALRALADGGRPVGRRSALAGATLGVAGLALAGAGHGRGFDGLLSIVAGALLVLVAIVLVLPLAVTRLAGPARWLAGRLFGRLGALAVGNAERHPVRLAATTAALVVGVAPLTVFAVLVGTARAQSDRELSENFPADFVVSRTGGDFAPSLVDDLRARPEFAVVVTGRVALAEADGCCARLGAAEGLGDRLAVEVREGALAGLAPGTAAVSTRFAETHHIGLGDRLPLAGWTATVVARFDDTPLPADVLVSRDDLAAAGLADKQYLLIRRAPGVDAGTATTVLERALAVDPVAVLSSTAQREQSLSETLDKRLNQFTVLLGLAMLIAVTGVANTLALSVLERTRELGVLRALGLTRGQVYRMLLVEAGLSIAAGLALGVAFGLGVGWLTALELITEYGHGAPAVPVPTIAAYVAAAAIAGALVCLVPARRAARAPIVEAINGGP